ncbi:MAG: T9SS type A sorting domain-containing protein, partial [Bacteroidia bacterium]
DNAMWIIGGYDGLNGNRKDVWYSEDGINWHELKNTPWPERHASAVYNYNHSLWVVAGNMWNDSWRLNVLMCPTLVSPPITTTVLNNATSTLIANYSAASSTYKWQLKNGQIWQDIINSTLINGADNDTLVLNQVTMLNNGQHYRCIVESGACIDSTTETILNVMLATTIKDKFPEENNIAIYPNPAGNFVTIEVKEQFINSNYKLVDQLGREVLSGKIHQMINTVDIEGLNPGCYFLVIEDKIARAFKLIKT